MVKLMPKHTDMSAVPDRSTLDLRNRAKERKRDIDSKHKWAPKWAVTGVPVVKQGPNGTVRPRAHVCSQQARAKERQNYLETWSRRNHLDRKRPVLNDDSNESQDSSADEEVSFEEEAPQLGEVDVKYSYDASRGPSHGSEILGMAVAKAVEKYEDDKTSKLVSDEYEVLDTFSEAGEEPCYALGDDDDDDFEMI